MSENKKIAASVVIGAMLFALLPMPYGYYQVMRWVVCGAMIFLAVDSGKAGSAWVYVWGILAGIYNPVVPVHSTREIWGIVNVVTIAASAIYIKRRISK